MTPEEAILEMGRPFYIIATGGGAGIQERLWNVCDISRVLFVKRFFAHPYFTAGGERCMDISSTELRERLKS